MKKFFLRTQSGFTLIEIITVIVILGILAAVAIPKYINMMEESKNKATLGAIATGAGEVYLRYANIILTSGSAPSMGDLKSVLDTSSSVLGDYSYTYATAGDSGITVTVTGPMDKLGTLTTKTILLNLN